MHGLDEEHYTGNMFSSWITLSLTIYGQQNIYKEGNHDILLSEEQ